MSVAPGINSSHEGAPADAGAPLRILHLTSSARWTSPASAAARLALEQQRAGHQVLVGCGEASGIAPHLERLGLACAEGFHFDRSPRPGRLLEDMRLLRRFVRQFQPDIIHCHQPHDHWITALALRRPMAREGRRVAIVRTIHRESAPRTDLAHRWLIGKGAEMIIAVSQQQRRRLIEDAGLPIPRVAWVRGAVDTDRFCPGRDGAAVRERTNLPREAKVAGLIAPLQRQAGHGLFIDALEAVVGLAPLAMFVIAGRGELKTEIKQRLKQHPLRVHLKRLAPRDHDPCELYAALDVVVVISPGSDGAGRSALEAMACGRPVVVSALGALDDVVDSGVTGLKFAPGDRDAMSHAIADLLNDPDRRGSMGRAARAYVEANHTPAQQAAAVLTVYHEALARRAKLAG